MPPSLSEQQMNRLGAEGRELVDTRVVTFQQDGTTRHRTDYHFKRAKWAGKRVCGAAEHHPH